MVPWIFLGEVPALKLNFALKRLGMRYKPCDRSSSGLGDGIFAEFSLPRFRISFSAQVATILRGFPKIEIS